MKTLIYKIQDLEFLNKIRETELLIINKYLHKNHLNQYWHVFNKRSKREYLFKTR